MVVKTWEWAGILSHSNASSPNLGFCLFEAGSCSEPLLVSNSAQSSCLSLPRAEITGMSYHICLHLWALHLSRWTMDLMSVLLLCPTCIFSALVMCEPFSPLFSPTSPACVFCSTCPGYRSPVLRPAAGHDWHLSSRPSHLKYTITIPFMQWLFLHLTVDLEYLDTPFELKIHKPLLFAKPKVQHFFSLLTDRYFHYCSYMENKKKLYICSKPSQRVTTPTPNTRYIF